MSDTVRITIDEARSFLLRVFLKTNLSETAALSVADALVAAQAEGQAGHGLSRVSDYVAQARSGKVNVTAQIKMQRTSPAALYIDADQGFAYPALDAARDAGIPLAREMGIALMAVGNSHHCGALSVQVERFAAQGLICLMLANTPKAIAPWGSAQALFGTNPIAFASPVAGAAPVVIDLSLSRVARGKVMAAKKQGQSIPSGWALDAHGHPTTDPDAALGGTMVPIGEAKGTALALMVELMAAALSGSAFSSQAGSFFDAQGAPPRVGQTMIAINPDIHGDYAQRAAQLIDEITAMEGARIPGARRLVARARAQDHGMDVPAQIWQSIQMLADT